MLRLEHKVNQCKFIPNRYRYLFTLLSVEIWRDSSLCFGMTVFQGLGWGVVRRQSRRTTPHPLYISPIACHSEAKRGISWRLVGHY